MSDTHINAYFEDVQQAEQRVVEARAQLEAAQSRLEDKKVEVNWQGKESVESAQPERPTTVQRNEVVSPQNAVRDDSDPQTAPQEDEQAHNRHSLDHVTAQEDTKDKKHKK